MHIHKQIAVVFQRNKARGDAVHQRAGPKEDATQNDEGKQGYADQPFHDTDIAGPHTVDALLKAFQNALGRARAWLEDKRTERRRQGKRVDRRDHHSGGNGDCKLRIQPPGDPGHEGYRHKDRQQDQSCRNNGAGDLAHGFAGGLRRAEPFFGNDAFDIFDHDDCVIDNNPDGQHQRKKRDRVQRHAKQKQKGERPDQGYGNRNRRNDSCAGAAKENEDHSDDQHKGLHQGGNHVFEGLFYEKR